MPWQSQLQKCVALSTIKVMFIATTKVSKMLLWMKNFMLELWLKQERYALFCDSQSAIYLSKNSSFHSRSKHIDVRYHWIQNALNSKLFELEKVYMDDNGLDTLTKVLLRGKLEVCKSIVSIYVPPHSR